MTGAKERKNGICVCVCMYERNIDDVRKLNIKMIKGVRITDMYIGQICPEELKIVR